MTLGDLAEADPCVIARQSSPIMSPACSATSVAPRIAVLALLEVDAQEALVLAVEDGAVDLVELDGEGVHLDPLRLGVLLVEARRGRSPGWCRCTRGWSGRCAFARPKKSAFWITMRAWASAMWVNWKREATSPQAKIVRVGGAQVVVHLDAGLVVATPAASRPRPSTFGARPAATRISSATISRRSPSRSRRPSSSRPAAPHLDDLDAELEVDAVARQRLLDDLGGVGVLAGQDVAVHVEQGDPAAEAGEGLRQLAADRAAADHHQPRRQLGEVEDRLVGADSRPRRGRGSAARRRARRSRSRRGGSAGVLPPTSTCPAR